MKVVKRQWGSRRDTKGLTGDTRKIFVSRPTVDESNSARVLIGCKPITKGRRFPYRFTTYQDARRVRLVECLD